MSSEEKHAERLRERARAKREVTLMLAQGAVERSRMAGHAAPGRGREAAGGDTSSAATPGRRDGGGMRLGGAGTGAEAGNWSLGQARGVQPEQRRWGIRPPALQYDRGGAAQTTRDRHPAYMASGGEYGDGDGAAPNRLARAPPPSPPGHTTSYKKN
jgi:hypothetical protein